MPRRVIEKEELATITLWDLPMMAEGDEEPIEISPRQAPMPTAEDLQKIQDQVYAEAHAQATEKGYAEGLKKGIAEGREQGRAEGVEQGRQQAYDETVATMQAQGERLRELMQSLTEPFAELDQQVEEQLVMLASLMAKHIVRRELRTDPAQVIATVKQAVAALPIATRNIQVLMHPEDAQLVRESMSLDQSSGEERRWYIVEDPTVTRGGCNIETEHSRIDVTVESRLGAIIAQVLGGEREGD